MSVIRTEVAVGAWAERANLEYVPCNRKVAGYGYVDAAGRKVSPGSGGDVNRRPYLVETGSSVTYIKYDDGVSPIFRVTEESSEAEEA